jgi:phenylalanyl-tRNA synthetase beta chain
MLYSHDWLRAFVPHDLAPDAIQGLIGTHVATVDAAERLRDDLRAIVVARVVEAGRHPNSDHLWVTQVDDGSGTVLDVVCGAPNVTVGTLYPFARTGSTLPGGLTIEKRKIRGEPSNGMLCSARELGLGSDHEGIMALDVEVAPGTPFLDALAIGDTRFDVDVLPNRPDLLSHVGMARELAALTGVALQDPPEIGAVPRGDDAVRDARRATHGGATVQLDDPDGCPRYMAVVIRGVTVGPSPDWLVQRLASVGLRSISNVVDATNYILHAYGQPMHAFDLGRVDRSTIVVRRAADGERLTTLDGVERTLDARMTVIADPSRPLAIAGVMGGLDSEVTAETRDVLLEVAYFRPRNVRITRRALGLTTDASYRFERGIDPAITPRALALAATLIAQVTGGTVGGPPLDVGAPPHDLPTVTLRPSRVARLLGDAVEGGEITRLLTGIGFDVRAAGDDALAVTPPSWRGDVARDVDLVEEVARLRGYDVLPDDLKPFRPGTVPDHPLHVTTLRVRNALVADGLFEVKPLPFVRGADESHVRVLNPLADDEPHLRRSILETLARRAEYNLSRMRGDVRMFEVGSVFAHDPEGSPLPAESMAIGALIMGRRRPSHFTEPRPPAFDAWDAKALGERVAALAYPGRPVLLLPDTEDGRLWTVAVGTDVDRQVIGEVRVVALDRPVWAAEAFGVEIRLGALSNAPSAPRGGHDYTQAAAGGRAHAAYRPVPTTPPAEFDLALLVPESLAAAEVERVLRRSAGELLERLDLFDEFRGEGLPAGHRSLAWRLTFRDPVRTLRDKEVDGRRQKILRALESELGVRQRTA